ncbi:uncharacterized protein CDAR_99761 [Caerostris darwini]|uniref:Uncharacterized protein n=1 Tax=Caerostris darwini TaxID=1538125 RepID=A0AAV4SRK3_9ARAC|nr:uncharacterized protein CDAR_99761 [Caerostris darwini]
MEASLYWRYFIDVFVVYKIKEQPFGCNQHESFENIGVHVRVSETSDRSPLCYKSRSEMDSRRWGFIFVFLLSTNYLVGVLGQVRGRPNPMMDQTLNQCFERARQRMQGNFNLQDNTLEGGLQLTGGSVSGLSNFKVVPPNEVICFKDFGRIFIKVSFLDITVTFVVTLLDDLLGGLLGQLGSTLARLVGQVVNLVVNLVALEINVVITVDQRFLPGSSCTVSSFRVTRISEIKLLSLNLTQLLVGVLGDLLVPVVDTLVRNLLGRQVRAIITSEIQKETFTRDMFNCGA